MRPRVFPAEDGEFIGMWVVEQLGFNEAAGIPRGRRGRDTGGRLRRRRFNEAAGIPRGRHGIPRCMPVSIGSLQ